jgi:hypothetical protein
MNTSIHSGSPSSSAQSGFAFCFRDSWESSELNIPESAKNEDESQKIQPDGQHGRDQPLCVFSGGA